MPASNQTFPAPQPKDKAFVDYNEEAREWHTKGIIDIQVGIGENTANGPPKIDPDSEPFSHIYEGNPDGGDFTKTEVVDQPNIWYWVERLLPKRGDLLAPIIEGKNTATGWTSRPATAPARTYFVPRTRSELFPVYKQVEADEFHKDLDYKGSPRMQPILRPPWMRKDPISFKTLTVIHHVDGEVRDFERDLRSWLEVKHQSKILTACHEGNGRVRIKGDYVEDVVNWLKEQGF